MSDSDKMDSSVHRAGNRRRTLLVALLGAGAPMAHKVLPGEWVAPVVNSVILPAHAQTSPDDDDGNDRPTGDFGGGEFAVSTDSSLFDNIVQRTEEEILDLFISAAEANGCTANSSCDTNGDVKVQVAASINENPSDNECLQALVTISDSSCSNDCILFEFQVSVDGNSVEIVSPEGCELSLSGITLNGGGISGSWSYESGSDFSDDGIFNSPPVSGGGCGTLPGCVET